MKTRLSFLMILALLVALFATSVTRADGPALEGIVGAGEYHTCGLMPSGAVDCWGDNSWGQAEDQPGPYTQVSVGNFHTCGLTPSGAADCWGSTSHGQGDDQPGPYAQISAGWLHTCAVTPSGAVDCWGDNVYGQAADQPGPYSQVSAGGHQTCALAQSGAADCWGDNLYGSADNQPGPYTQVSTGFWHSCALTPSGAVECWGDNLYGQAVGQSGPYSQVSAGGHHTCALTPSGAADCWGDNQYGQAGDQPGPYTQVSAGFNHTCALTPSGAVDCWGWDYYGQAEDRPGPYGPYIPPNPAPIVYDNFDDNITAPSLWSLFQRGGPTASEMNQRLEITLPADSAGVQFDAGYNSVCQLRGDFDIQVDYTLLTWPFRNGVRVSLNTTHGNMERASFGSSPPDFAGGPEAYLTDFAGLVKGITSTSDSSGRLRLERVGATLTGYYFVNGGWVTVASNSNPAYSEDTAFALGSWSHDSVFADQQVKLAFDNMIINEGELVCPPIDVMIDIRPDDVANKINPRAKGRIPVAILTTNSFAATTVEPSTVSFGPAGATAVASASEDVDTDGDTDLLLFFKIQDTGIRCGDMIAFLAGETKSGRDFVGSDSLVTVGCR